MNQTAQYQLKLNQIACERGETRLFEGCSFTVQSGEWVQIEGHNGIGKTSLLRILAGLFYLRKVRCCGTILQFKNSVITIILNYFI